MRWYRKILYISYKDHVTNEEGPLRDANCSGMVMSPVHQVWPKPSCKAQWNGEEDKADRGRGGKTTSRNGQVWSSPSPRGQWRTGKNGGNWLRNYLWCPIDPRGYGIDDEIMMMSRGVWTWKLKFPSELDKDQAIVLNRVTIHWNDVNDSLCWRLS